MSKDENEIRYYREKLHEINIKSNRHTVPNFASAGTNWRFTEMHEVLSFCEENDTNRPNFLHVAIRQGLLSEAKREAGTVDHLDDDDKLIV